MMKYRAIFSNQKGARNAEIDCNSIDYCYPLIFNGITIDTDGFELLSIANPEQYSEIQLALFEYDTKLIQCANEDRKLLVLKNYQLNVFIPIHILEIQSGKKDTADIQIIMKHDGENGEKGIKRICSLLGKSSENYNMEEAFREVQAQLAESHCMETCSNCKNSWWSIYGGTEFCNHLCFKSDAEAFQAIKDKNKLTVARFMKYGNDQNWQSVRLTDYCDMFDWNIQDIMK